MRKVSFIRHGKAGAAQDGQKDVDRVLNEVGKGQADARGKKMNGTAHGLVISSPAPRASETGERVTGKPQSDIVIIESLYPAPDDGAVGARLDKLFNMPHLGYATVTKYLAETDGACVSEWAQAAWRDCKEKIDAAGNPDDVTIFGHAVCLPALGMQLCTDKDLLDFRGMIAEMNLGECEGFTLTLEDGKVSAIETIRG